MICKFSINPSTNPNSSTVSHVTGVGSGITTNPEKLRAKWEWLTSMNKHKISSFLGLCMNYRWFISGFVNIAKLLTKCMKEKQAFQWTPEVEATFQTLKEALCTAPILAYQQPRERFVVDTDTSNIGLEERYHKYRTDKDKSE
jgi:hypothetical protein